MIRLPRKCARWMLELGSRPDYLAEFVEERPEPSDLRPGVMLCEVRDGFHKWAHLLCPRCGEHIEIPIAGPDNWTLHVDRWWRPTLSPSIWQRKSCGAHFFIVRGKISWSTHYE